MEVLVKNEQSTYYGKTGVVVGDTGKEMEVRFPGGDVALIAKGALERKH